MIRGHTSMSPQISALAKALSQAQGEFKPVKKNAVNPFFKSKYAALGDVIEGSREVLHKYGLSIVQAPSGGGDGTICLTSYLIHESGEYISGELIMSMKDASPQAAGSALSYARRYALAAMLGLATEDDDDGNHATHGEPVTASNISQAYTDARKKYMTQSTTDDYIVAFGKFKGKHLSDIDPKDVASYTKYLMNNTDGKPLSHHANEFIERGNKYIESYKTTSAAGNTIPKSAGFDIPPPNDEDAPLPF